MRAGGVGDLNRQSAQSSFSGVKVLVHDLLTATPASRLRADLCWQLLRFLFFYV